MLTNAMGLIMADNPRVRLSELTEPRALAAVPFAGRYRIIDFILSSMVHSGIKHVGVYATAKYRSLSDHIRTGASWDLDRMEQGLAIIPPFLNATCDRSAPEDLTGLYDFVKAGKEEFVVICDPTCVINCDLRAMIHEHADSDADMTIMYNNDGENCSAPCLSLSFDENGCLHDFMVDPPEVYSPYAAIGILMMRRELLAEILGKDIARGKRAFSLENFLRMYETYKIKGYKYDDTVLRMNSPTTYFKNSLKLLEPDIRKDIFRRDRPVFTKVKNMAPARYEKSSKVANSLVSDGCLIEGEVKNSILFRGVKVGEHAVLENCIIMQDCVVKDGAELKNVIIDKDAVVNMRKSIIGQSDYPIVVAKGVEI